jgi:hypothetical protein
MSACLYELKIALLLPVPLPPAPNKQDAQTNGLHSVTSELSPDTHFPEGCQKYETSTMVLRKISM